MEKTNLYMDHWQICLIAILSLLGVLAPNYAFAAVAYPGPGGTRGYIYMGIGYGSSVGGVLCGIASAFDGEIAAAIGTIAVCTVGVLASVGRIQWTTALYMAVGVSILFGVSMIMNFYMMAGALGAAGGGYCF